jgi:phosphate transport system ATP-binding protein
VSVAGAHGAGEPVLSVEHLTVRAPSRTILADITLDFPDRDVTGIIGPSGCGKTTFIRTLNRMIETSPGLSVEGTVRYRGQDIYDRAVNPVIVRQRIGMVFQRPTVFPLSIYENVAFGLRLQRTEESTVEEVVTRSLTRAGLWDEVGNNLDQPALELSGGQQQRVCIARAIAIEPRVLLFDEPTSNLDPLGAQKVEKLIAELKRDYSVIMVTHNLQQAARVASRTAFLYEGRLVEFGPTETLFERPRERLTQEYITGRFG